MAIKVKIEVASHEFMPVLVQVSIRVAYPEVSINQSINQEGCKSLMLEVIHV